MLYYGDQPLGAYYKIVTNIAHTTIVSIKVESFLQTSGSGTQKIIVCGEETVSVVNST